MWSELYLSVYFDREHTTQSANVTPSVWGHGVGGFPVVEYKKNGL
jgi:hypothetical protein